jgi:hypothetical protein
VIDPRRSSAAGWRAALAACRPALPSTTGPIRRQSAVTWPGWNIGDDIKPPRTIAAACSAALAIAGGPAATVQPVFAHHAMVMYDRLRTMTLVGTVVEFQWTNPHVFLLVNGSLDVDAEPAIWRLETTSPTNLIRLGGWSATALKPGDRVSIIINPNRESREKSARLVRVTLIDTGQELGTAYLDLDLRSQ